MPRDLITVVITALISAGGASFVGTLLRGVGRLRSGARAREREAVADLARARDDAEDRCRVETRDRIFWQNVTAQYAYQLRRAGIEPVPADPVPPSERAAHA